MRTFFIIWAALVGIIATVCASMWLFVTMVHEGYSPFLDTFASMVFLFTFAPAVAMSALYFLGYK